MPFVLVSTSTGDELIHSRRNVVMVSDDRAALEAERERRAAERKEWLATHEIPWWAECSVIASETIEEVPALPNQPFVTGEISTVEGNL